MKRLEDFLVTGLINEDGGISGDDTPAARQAADKMAGVCGGIPPLLARDLPSEQPSEEPSEKPWNWREHTREENIAHGKEVEKKREQRRLKNVQDLALSGRPSMRSAKSFDPAEVKARNAASDLMNAIQNPNLYSDEEKAELSKRARETNALAQPAKQPKKISGMYWVTDQDFKTATGMDYDAMSREHQRLFFDLVARGPANVPSTTGVGQGPAYGSAESFTMRQRPQEVPQYGTPTAWYDKVDGQVAATTPQSRAREAELEADLLAKLKIQRDDVVNTKKIEKEAERQVAGELAMDYIKRLGDSIKRKDSEDKKINEPLFDKHFGYGTPDVERGQFPIFDKDQPSISTSKFALPDSVMDFIRRSTAQPMPTSTQIKLYGEPEGRGANMVDVQRGQYNYPSPFVEYEAPEDPNIVLQIGSTKKPIEVDISRRSKKEERRKMKQQKQGTVNVSSKLPKTISNYLDKFRKA